MTGNKGSCVWSLPRPLIHYTLLQTTAPSWRVNHLPERRDLIFSQPPKSQRRSPSFPLKASWDAHNQARVGQPPWLAFGGQGWRRGIPMSPRCCFSTCVFPCGLPMGLSLPASGHKLTTSFSPIHISSHKAGRNPKLLRLFPKTDKEQVPASLPKRVRPLSLLASDPGGQCFSSLSTQNIHALPLLMTIWLRLPLINQNHVQILSDPQSILSLLLLFRNQETLS